MDNEQKLTRRASLLRLAGLAATAAGGSTLLGNAEAEGAGPAGVATGQIGCVLAPELAEGPFYIAGEAFRRDITEGRPGTKLSLRTTIVNVSTCRPIRGAVVEIWHADAAGVYSGFGAGAANRTFLRGKQRTDRNGLAVFSTIYPGWYPGRTVHIHVKAWVGGSVVHTGQLFFPEATSDAVYAQPPYAARGARDRRNASDAIFVNGGSKGLLRTGKSGAGYTGSLTLGVMRS